MTKQIKHLGRFSVSRACHPFLLLTIAACPVLARANDPSELGNPNIVLILADDLGYSDLGTLGGELSTPHLDRLATQGRRLTRCFNAGMCVTSRASLMTGKWWPQGLAGFKQTRILSESLRKAGYETALIGKWHLNGHPMDRGFNHFFGFLGGFSDHFAGGPGYQFDRQPFVDFPPDYYSTDAFVDRAVDWIESHSAAPNRVPLFLFLSLQAPHNPLQAPEEDIAKHRGRYLDGWQSIREARFDRQRELGIVPSTATLPRYPENLPQWDLLSPEQRDLEDLRMATYAAMVERIDEGVGRIMQSLQQTDRDDNTLVIFLSDNGADSFSVVDQQLLAKRRLPGDRGSNWQLGTGWAYASVTPWRLYKISQHAGGVTTGAIVRWPKRIQATGTMSHSPIHFVDFLPTLLEASGVGDKVAETDGVSFLPLLQDEHWKRERPLFFQFKDNRAIRTERWTLAEVDAAGWQLFDAENDPLETTDLAQAFPDQVRKLETRWSRWWSEQTGETQYQGESTQASVHYRPQGDRGSGATYVPSAMPKERTHRNPLP